MEKLNKIVLTTLANLMTFTSFGLSVPVFAEEKEVPVNITVEATPMNVTLPTSIELANAGNTVDVTVASTNKIVNNANTGAVYIQDISLETLNNWSLGDKTAKYEEMSKDSKNLYLGIKLSDETDFANLKESYEPTYQKLEAKSEKGLLFEGKTNITSSKLTNQVGNLVVTVGESEKISQKNILKNGFLDNNGVIDKTTITEMSFMTTQDNINPSKSWDASVEGDGSVMAWVDQNNPTKVLIGVKNGKVIAPQDSTKLFSFLVNLEYINVQNLDTSKVTNMSWMFFKLGQNKKNLNIKDLSNLNVENVVNMNRMFYMAGEWATDFNLDLSNWNTSKVTDMAWMFENSGMNATTFNLIGLNNLDVSNVTDMSGMFANTGAETTDWNIGNLDTWDTSNVTTMSSMFFNAGRHANSFNIGNIGKWNVSNVTNMDSMFSGTGYVTTTFTLGDLSKWDVSNVIDMQDMFAGTGSRATTFSIGNLENWNVSNVTNMERIFEGTGVVTSFVPPSWVK